MQFKDNINYTILSNKIDTNLMTNFLEYQVIEDNVDYEELRKRQLFLKKFFENLVIVEKRRS